MDGDLMGCCGKIRGAVKMARAELGVGVVRLPQLIDARQDACRKCPDCDLGRCMFVPEGGKACMCFVWPKSRLPKETCPAGRWPSPDAFRSVPADKT